jgi:signal peptidase I
MHPTIREGETITVEPVTASAVNVGDIVLYRLDDGLIAHRVKGIEGAEGNGTRFILRGDASGNSDAPVNAEQILGRVISVERAGRSIDLYSTRTKIFCTSYILASRFKQWLTGAVDFNQ